MLSGMSEGKPMMRGMGRSRKRAVVSAGTVLATLAIAADRAGVDMLPLYCQPEDVSVADIMRLADACAVPYFALFLPRVLASDRTPPY